MFHPIPFAVVIAVGTFLTLPVSGQSLDGEWSVASGKMDGQVVPANALALMKLTINSGKFSAVSANLASSGSLSGDNFASPAQLTFNIDNGADKGNKVNAIYKFNNGELTITFSKDGSFPAGFDSTAGNKALQLVYRQGGIQSSPDGESSSAANPGQQPNSLDTGVTGGGGGGAAAGLEK